MLHAGVCMVRALPSPASPTVRDATSSSRAWWSGTSPHRIRQRIGRARLLSHPPSQALHRHRRATQPVPQATAVSRAIERLMMLDAVLDQPSILWLAAERDSGFPLRTFGTALHPGVTPQLRFGTPRHRAVLSGPHPCGQAGHDYTFPTSRRPCTLWCTPNGSGSTSRRSPRATLGRGRERELLVRGPTFRRKEVPTLEQFASRFMDGHARANQLKPSGIAHKELVLKNHLLPMLGAKRPTPSPTRTCSGSSTSCGTASLAR